MSKPAHISNTGLELVKHFESCPLKAYRDEVGVWTIGWGHTNDEGGIKITPGMVITQQQADDQLRLDMVAHEDRVKRFLDGTIVLSQEQFDALVSFDFNTGGLMLGSVSVRPSFEASMLRDERCGMLHWSALKFDADHDRLMLASASGLRAGVTPSTLLTKVNINQPFSAALEFAKWVHAGGRVLAGLVRRRNAERDLFCGFGWERWKA